MLNRRHFLQLAGSALAVNSLKQFGSNYGNVLAANTSRKVALLVGINEYPNEADRLDGCVNDVKLQYHLLKHRFGFKDKDIHILKDKEATRDSILGAFEEYLIKPVKEGDVAVFHYSGHGSRVEDPEPILFEPGKKFGLSGTFVPVNSQLPIGYPEKVGTVDDIMGHTLFLLMSAVKTENFTAVLDSCFSGAATRKIKVRAREGGKGVQISPQEKAYQEKWLSKLNLSRKKFVELYRQGVAKGVVLAATDPFQLAVDARLNGFYAGAFTYLLTNYLWQQDSPTPENAIDFAVKELPEEFSQTPRYEVKVGSEYNKQPIYFISNPNSSANTVITNIKNNKATLWLGGVDLGKLEPDTVFKVVDDDNSAAKIVYKSRQGLVGTGIVQGKVKPNALLRIQ